jgi:hypothetical protein
MNRLFVHHAHQVPASQPTGLAVDVRNDPEFNDPVESTFVCVYGCGVYEVGFTDVNGEFSPTISPDTIGDIQVTVTMQDFLPSVTHVKVNAGDADACVRDFEGDDGSILSWDANHNERYDGDPPDHTYWVSPDILIDRPPYNGFPGQPGEETPVAGETDRLYAYVENIGSETVNNVSVGFYWTDFGVGCPSWPDDFHFIGNYAIPELDPGETETAFYVQWEVPAFGLPEHTCIYVRAECATDRIVNDEYGWENNIACRSYAIEALQDTPDCYMASVDFEARNPDAEKTKDIVLSLCVEQGTSEWTWDLTSSEPSFEKLDINTYVFHDVEPGGERSATLIVESPKGLIHYFAGNVHISGMAGYDAIGGVSVRIDPPQTGEDVPTLTEWGFIIFTALLLGWMAWVVVRRRKAVNVRV